MLKEYVRSRNVHENKERQDHLSETKATFLRNFRTFNRKEPVFCRFSQKPMAVLSLFERWVINSPRQLA